MNFSYDLNFEKVLVPNKVDTAWDWGISCDAENKDCELSQT